MDNGYLIWFIAEMRGRSLWKTEEKCTIRFESRTKPASRLRGWGRLGDCGKEWSRKSDSNRRPADYEWVLVSPLGAARDRCPRTLLGFSRVASAGVRCHPLPFVPHLSPKRLTTESPDTLEQDTGKPGPLSLALSVEGR